MFLSEWTSETPGVNVSFPMWLLNKRCKQQMVKSILKTWRGAPTTNQTKENNINTTTTTNKKNPKPTKPVTTETPLTGCPVEPEASLGPCCNHSCTVFQFSDCLFINLDDKCCYLCYQWFKHASLNKMFHIL